MAVQRPGPGTRWLQLAQRHCYQHGLAWTGKRRGQHHTGRMLPPLLGAEAEHGLLCSRHRTRPYALDALSGAKSFEKVKEECLPAAENYTAPVQKGKME